MRSRTSLLFAGAFALAMRGQFPAGSASSQLAGSVEAIAIQSDLRK